MVAPNPGAAFVVEPARLLASRGQVVIATSTARWMWLVPRLLQAPSRTTTPTTIAMPAFGGVTMGSLPMPPSPAHPGIAPASGVHHRFPRSCTQSLRHRVIATWALVRRCRSPWREEVFQALQAKALETRHGGCSRNPSRTPGAAFESHTATYISDSDSMIPPKAFQAPNVTQLQVPRASSPNCFKPQTFQAPKASNQKP